MASTVPSPPYNSEEDSDYRAEEGEEEVPEYELDDEDYAPSDGDPVIEVLEIPEQGSASGSGDEWSEDEENRVEIARDGSGECSGSENPNGGFEIDRSAAPNCLVCFEPWTTVGPHRVCCIPCGHVYGRSCLEKWAQRRGKNNVKCPMCNRMFNKRKDITNLFAPLVAVQNNELEKEVHSLREKNKLLQHENDNLLEEISNHRKHQMERECFERSKITCLDHASNGVLRRKLFEPFDERWICNSESLLEDSIGSQNYHQGGSQRCSLVLQARHNGPLALFFSIIKNELVVKDARTLGIDASSQTVYVAGKSHGVIGEHAFSKISLLAPNVVQKVMLPLGTGVIRDITESNNLALKYDLPVPAWSCSGDIMSQNHIYAGLQNGTLLVFDIRQTATYLESIDGLSRYPIHTIHSVGHNDSTRIVVTASSLGPCVWNVGGNGERPFYIPSMENQGVCIALACSDSNDDMVASFRPKVEVQNDTAPSQVLVSPSPAVCGSGKLGSHVLINRMNATSYQKQSVAFSSVSEVRMSKSAIICTEGNSPFFAYGEESSHGACLWDLPSFHMYTRLKPHQHPILDLKYARSAGPGFLGCLSENVLQIFRCF